MNKSKEIWKPILDGAYQVSSRGRVRHLAWSIRKTPVATNGYPVVSLSTKEGVKVFTVHSLVAKAFIAKGGGAECVNHKNCIKTDNRVENLEWVTYAKNSIHARKNIKFKVPDMRGSKSNMAILNEAQVVEIKKLLLSKIPHSKIAPKFKVSESAISAISSGQNWGHIILERTNKEP